jgi:chromosome segregation ATPase
LLDEEVLRRSETARLERELSKLESVLKASRIAQENLKADARQSKHEADEAKRLAGRVESDMHRMIDEQKNWRTEKYALEDRVHAATEERLEMEKNLIKARSEAHNFFNEFTNTKKMLDHAKAVRDWRCSPLPYPDHI